MSITQPETADVEQASIAKACESCRRQAATHVLTYPDTRFIVCPSCIPAALIPLAEPVEHSDLDLP